MDLKDMVLIHVGMVERKDSFDHISLDDMDLVLDNLEFLEL